MRVVGEEDFNRGFRYVQPRKDVRVWTIADRFGNLLLEWQHGHIKTKLTLSDMESYLVVEEDGKTDVYFLFSSKENGRSVAIKYPEGLGIKDLFNVDYKTLLAVTDESVYFITPGFPARKSDDYDALYSHDDVWVYEKKVEAEGYQTVITGPINTDGQVGTICYDKLLRKTRPVVKTKTSIGSYDIIDTTDVEQELREKQQEDNKRKIAKVRALVKDYNKGRKNQKDE